MWPRFPADGKNRAGLPPSQGCRAARLPVSAGQVAHDAHRRWQPGNGIVTFIAVGAWLLGQRQIGPLPVLRYASLRRLPGMPARKTCRHGSPPMRGPTADIRYGVNKPSRIGCRAVAS
jgi:hypothetical protein